MFYIVFLSSLSSSFVVCGDFIIHVNSVSPLVSEFKSVVDGCSLTQYVDILPIFIAILLDLLLAPTEFSFISEVHSSCFISDHKVASCLVDFLSVANHQDKVTTFCQYHKINFDKLKGYLVASAFATYPSNDPDTLYEQYVSSLTDLLDIHAPLKIRRLTKPAPSWITNEF